MNTVLAKGIMGWHSEIKKPVRCFHWALKRLAL